MSTFTIDLDWKLTTEFSYEKYNRDHFITLGGKQVINNSAAADFFGNASMTNPEELLASALASCHMLTFLAVCSKSGYNVASYSDHATATLDKNSEGKMCITEIALKPMIEFTGEKKPDAEQLKSLHDKAHRNCFVANSIQSKVTIH